MPIIRPMKNTDLQEVLRIENVSFSQPWPKEAFELDSHTAAFVLFEDPSLLGYIIYHKVIDEGMIINFAIDPAHQNQGLGTLLLEHTLNLMIEHGVRSFYLDVRVSNLNAQHLYNKFGFIRLGERKGYYSKPDEDAIVMFKSVAEVLK